MDNDFCGEAVNAVRYDLNFIREDESWPKADYIILEKDRNSVKLKL